MRGVMLSLRKEVCKMLFSEKLPILFTRTAPKDIDKDFTVFIYEQGGRGEKLYKNVLGQFTCTKLAPLENEYYESSDVYSLEAVTQILGITQEEFLQQHRYGEYGWRVEGVLRYDEPKQISEFLKPCLMPECPYCPACPKGHEYISEDEADAYRQGEGCSTEWICQNFVKTPPKPWCYVNY